MTTEKKQKPKLVLLLDIAEDHSYGYNYLKANVRIGKLDQNREYVGLDSYSDDLDDFEINAQADDHATKLYGSEPSFKFYSTKLRDAERAVKVLRRFEAKMGKLREEFGWPKGFAEYVSHASTALGIKEFAKFSEPGPNGRRFIEFTNREGIRNAIERAERDWTKQYQPEPEAVVQEVV